MKKYVIWFSKLKNTNTWLCMDISILHWVYLMTLWGKKPTTEHQQNWNLASLQTTRFRFGQKTFENKLYAWQYEYAVKMHVTKIPRFNLNCCVPGYPFNNQIPVHVPWYVLVNCCHLQTV